MTVPAGLREEVDGDTEGGGVLRWTLDHAARRNAVGPDVLRWIAERCPSLRGESVVLSGAGSQAFCAGFDLTALKPTAQGPAPDAPLAAATAAMEDADATFIAAINGLAIGAGVELLSACDLRIAVEDAWFAVPAAKLGVVYHAAGLARLHRVFGPSVLRRLLLLGQRVPATDALPAGALTELCSPDALESRVQATLAALRAGNPRSQATHRAVLRALDRGPLSPEQLQAHERARTEAYASIAARHAAARTP